MSYTIDDFLDDKFHEWDKEQNEEDRWEIHCGDCGRAKNDCICDYYQDRD